MIAEIIYSVDRSTKLPIIDGNVLNDEAWSSIKPIVSFTQKSPDEGQAATEQTVLRLMYSDRMFYLSVVCYDTNPNAIVISDTRTAYAAPSPPKPKRFSKPN